MTIMPTAHCHRLRRSAGVGLVTAIFLLVVLAGLGVAMVTIFTSQQAGSAMDEQGARAYQAARAGIEWGVFQQLRNGSCTDSSFALPPGTSLSGFAVTVSCTSIAWGGPIPASGDAQALNRWLIRATACNQPTGGGRCPNQSNNPDYVQRVMEVQL
jgi:MSHA biogenesis protein MshP